MALFRTKFACKSIFRNLVFRWESCKGSVWENVKKKLKSVHLVGPRDWISQLASRQSWHTYEACRGAKESRQLEHYMTKFQSSQTVSSRLKLTTQLSREVKSPDHSVWEKLTFRIPNTHQYKYPLYPRIVDSFQREFSERNPREK